MHQRYSTVLVILTLCFLILPAAANAHGANPNHLRANLISPFNMDARITSAATDPNHAKIWGDLAMDVSVGRAGDPVYFDFQAVSPATAVRGLVLEGGKNAPSQPCINLQDGGYKMKIEVQAFYNGAWSIIGWVWYVHIDGILRNNGEYVTDGSQIAKVSSMYGGTCSSRPHVHLSLYNLNHYAGYVPRAEQTWFGPNDALGCVGGQATSVQACP